MGIFFRWWNGLLATKDDEVLLAFILVRARGAMFFCRLQKKIIFFWFNVAISFLMIYKPSVSSMYKSQYFNFNLEEVYKKILIGRYWIVRNNWIIAYSMNMQWLEIWAWISATPITHGHLHTGQLSRHFFLTSDQSEACYLGPKLYPRGGFFGPWFFIIIKNSHKDLSNEGSNFILSSLEVGHWVAQT